MREVIYLDKKENDKPVEFTHRFDRSNGLVKTEDSPTIFNSVIYLGKCVTKGDLFAAHGFGIISLYKGHLNSGKY